MHISIHSTDIQVIHITQCKISPGWSHHLCALALAAGSPQDWPKEPEMIGTDLTHHLKWDFVLIHWAITNCE